MPLTVKNSRGFTLIELLVVISIMGLLTSVVFASLTSARDRGRLGAAQYFSSGLYHGYAADALAMYNFDSNLATDETGSYNLTLTATQPAPDTNTPNNSSQSIAFPGNDAVGASTAIMTPGKVWTWATWVKVNSGTGIFLTYGVSANYLRYFSGSFRLSYYTSTPSQQFLIDPQQRSYGVWYHVAASHYEDATGAHTTTLYVDGKEVARDTNYSLFSNGVTGSLILGRYSPAITFNGNLDDVRIYTQSLLGADIQKIYAEGRAAHPLALNK